MDSSAPVQKQASTGTARVAPRPAAQERRRGTNGGAPADSPTGEGRRAQRGAQRLPEPARRRRPKQGVLDARTHAEAVFDREAEALTRRGGSWHRAGNRATRRSVRSWASRAEWAADLIAWVESADADEARTQHQGSQHYERVVATDSCIAVGLLLATVADGDGSNVTISNASLARILGFSESTVLRARRVLRAGGFEVVVAPGGRLYAHERAEAAAKHGGRQWKCANTTALTQPRRSSRGTSDGLPRSGSTGSGKSPSTVHSKRATREAAASRPPAGTKIHSPKHQKPVPLGIKRLAACLVDRDAAAVDPAGASTALTALDPLWRSADALPQGRAAGLRRGGAGFGGHIGQVWQMLVRLEPLMRRAGIVIDGDFRAAQNAALDLHELRDRWAAAGAGYAAPGRSRNPLGEFYTACRHALEAAIGEGYEPRAARGARIEQEAAANLARLNAEHAQREAERRRLAADETAQAAAAAFFEEARRARLDRRPRHRQHGGR